MKGGGAVFSERCVPPRWHETRKDSACTWGIYKKPGNKAVADGEAEGRCVGRSNKDFSVKSGIRP